MHSLSVDYMWFLLGTEEKPVKSFFTSPKNNTEINGFAEHLTQAQTADSTWESSAYIFLTRVNKREKCVFSLERRSDYKTQRSWIWPRCSRGWWGVQSVTRLGFYKTPPDEWVETIPLYFSYFLEWRVRRDALIYQFSATGQNLAGCWWHNGKYDVSKCG